MARSRTSTGGSGRRKHARRLERAKRRNPAREQQAKTRMTEDSQFARMDLVNAFNVEVIEYSRDYHGGFRYRNIVFRRGDDVILNSEDDPSGNVWVGLIDEIRSSQDRSTTIAKVRWYYSPTDVAEHRKTFDPSRCAPFERILSDAYDYASPYTFRDRTHVLEYDEGALDPPSIRPTDFFVRTAIQVSTKQIKPPLGLNSCLCQIAYNLYPSGTPTRVASVTNKRLSARPSSGGSPQPDVMHFCPSLRCRKWYHTSCLHTMGYLDTISPTSTRGHRLLAVDPDKDMQFADNLDIVRALELFQHEESTIMHLPHSLVNIAQCPIVRSSGAPNGWAVGNVADVVLARRFVYAAIEHRGRPEHSQSYRDLVDRYDRHIKDWLWSLRLRTSPPGTSDGRGSQGEFGLDAGTMDVDAVWQPDRDIEMDALERLCEDLTAFGFLATVYPLYWDQRWREFQEMDEVMNNAAFICPQCRSAI
ncbi:hypothetical protein C8Q80DRAFT_1146905 [Daedaleopsis nitida]|nr:hypothetical protein C8Q80DRAFT_1146905 [Daedaleopsis nitida]